MVLWKNLKPETIAGALAKWARRRGKAKDRPAPRPAEGDRPAVTTPEKER